MGWADRQLTPQLLQGEGFRRRFNQAAGAFDQLSPGGAGLVWGANLIRW